MTTAAYNCECAQVIQMFDPICEKRNCRSGVAFAAIWEDPTPVTTHAGASNVLDKMK